MSEPDEISDYEQTLSQFCDLLEQLLAWRRVVNLQLGGRTIFRVTVNFLQLLEPSSEPPIEIVDYFEEDLPEPARTAGFSLAAFSPPPEPEPAPIDFPKPAIEFGERRHPTIPPWRTPRLPIPAYPGPMLRSSIFNAALQPFDPAQLAKGNELVRNLFASWEHGVTAPIPNLASICKTIDDVFSVLDKPWTPLASLGTASARASAAPGDISGISSGTPPEFAPLSAAERAVTPLYAQEIIDEQGYQTGEFVTRAEYAQSLENNALITASLLGSALSGGLVAGAIGEVLGPGLIGAGVSGAAGGVVGDLTAQGIQKGANLLDPSLGRSDFSGTELLASAIVGAGLSVGFEALSGSRSLDGIPSPLEGDTGGDPLPGPGPVESKPAIGTTQEHPETTQSPPLQEEVPNSAARSQTKKTFQNLFPDDIPRPANVIPNNVLTSVSQRNLAYVVKKDGTLVVGRNNQFQGHIDLANGEPVLAAGELAIYGGNLKFIDNFSGHYRPSGIEAQQAAESAFTKLGFDVAGKYVERALP